jgi:hypothetical protein
LGQQRLERPGQGFSRHFGTNQTRVTAGCGMPGGNGAEHIDKDALGFHAATINADLVGVHFHNKGTQPPGFEAKPAL